MVNKRLTEIADRLGKEKLDRRETINVRNQETGYNGELDGFTYIPSLGFYVANRISWDNRNWYECKERLKERNSFMMTPADFWKYYEHCLENREDIIEDMKDGFEDEWLDALVIDRKHLLVSPESTLDLDDGGSYSGGKEYKNCVPVQDGSFNLNNVSTKTGLPRGLAVDEDKREFLFRPSRSSQARGVAREGWEKIHLRVGLHPKSSTDIYKGVRECKAFV